MSNVDILFSNHLNETLTAASLTIPDLATAVTNFDAIVTCTGPEEKTIQNSFYFKTDSDIATTSSDDVKYYVDTSQWSSIVTDLNPITNGTISVANGGFVADESISESFLRHLANKLFGTHLGVDLFNNETTVKADIETSCGTLATNISNTISSVSLSGSDSDLLGSSGSHYLDDNTTSPKNITREFLYQLLKDTNSRNRFETLANYAVEGQTGVYKIPLIAGDTISYALTISPHANQDANVPTGTSSTSRKFLVKLVIQENLPTTTLQMSELWSSTTDMQNYCSNLGVTVQFNNVTHFNYGQYVVSNAVAFYKTSNGTAYADFTIPYDCTKIEFKYGPNTINYQLSNVTSVYRVTSGVETELDSISSYSSSSYYSTDTFRVVTVNTWSANEIIRFKEQNLGVVYIYYIKFYS